MLKEIINFIDKKFFYCILVLFLSACSASSGNIKEKRLDIEQELTQIIYSNARKNPNDIHIITKKLIQIKDWESAFLGYQWLCQYASSQRSNYCRLMWSSAKKSKRKGYLFKAAATNYSVNKTAYWLKQSQLYIQNEEHQFILNTLQDIPLTEQQLTKLAKFPKHFAQALFIKGKKENDIVLLHQAKQLFLQFQNWNKVGDSLLISAQIALSSKKNNMIVSAYFNEAILYYDLAKSLDKFELAINWGREHGIIW